MSSFEETPEIATVAASMGMDTSPDTGAATSVEVATMEVATMEGVSSEKEEVTLPTPTPDSVTIRMSRIDLAPEPVSPFSADQPTAP